MAIQLLSYVYIDAHTKQAHIDAMQLRPITPGVSEYMEAHLNDLYKKDNVTGKANFDNKEARDRFEVLREGSEKDFLDVTRVYSESMANVISGRMKSGFIVTIRRDFQGEIQSAVLKLDHQKGTTGTMQELERGKYDIGIVKGLLDIPGQLQKGAVYPDGRSGSDVVIGEKYGTTNYFAKVLGVNLQLPGALSAKQFAAILAKSLSRKKAMYAIRNLVSRDKKVEPLKVLKELVADEKDRGKINTEIKSLGNGLSDYVPSQHPIKMEISVDNIQIIASADAVHRQIDIKKDGDRWTVTITSESEPKLSVRLK